jgi:glycosyl transferase family 25
MGLAFNFFDAIEGAHLTQAEVEASYDAAQNARRYKHPLSLPEIGCYLSHHALWKRVVDQNLDGVVILEDDFDAEDNLKDVLEVIAERRLSGVLVKLCSGKSVRGMPVAALTGRYRLVAPNRVTGLAFGYALDRTAAALLLANALPFSRPLDIDLKHWWEFSLTILVVNPPPLRVGELGCQSSISASRAAAAVAAHDSAMQRFLAKLRYQLAYNVKLFRARDSGRRVARRLRDRLARET